MPDGAIPSLGGTLLWRPSTLSEDDERIGAEIELAGGALRRQNRGVRRVFALGWRNRTQAQVDALRAAAGPGALSYVNVDGVAYVVLAQPPQIVAVPGTEPRRYDASIVLREQTPRR